MVTKSFLQKQLEIGTRIEMEHTNLVAIAKKIAMDHLKESPYYYVELQKMEKRLKKYKK